MQEPTHLQKIDALKHMASEVFWYWCVSAAFYKGWDMTLVILAATPVLAGVGIAIGIVMANLGKKASDAYAKASSIVAENLGNVRTVLAFNGADRAVKSYEGVRTICTSSSAVAALCNLSDIFGRTHAVPALQG